MEHRYAQRYTCELPVMISCPRLGLARAWTKNISSGGVLVYSDCVRLPLNVPVTIAFPSLCDQPSPGFEATGLVVHQGAHGCGIMFDDLDPTCHGLVADLVADAARRSRTPSSHTAVA